MNLYRLVINRDEPQAAAPAQIITCPHCNARSIFCRSRTPAIDACGFETYSFACTECNAALAGVIDPSDDQLLLSEMAA
jgi:DNA-directed RNA polymerase subunit RPC12/RpoP